MLSWRCHVPTRRPTLVALTALVLSVLTIGFDITILNIALPTIATDLAAGTDTLQWIVNAYVLVFAGLLLPLGAIGDPLRPQAAHWRAWQRSPLSPWWRPGPPAPAR